MDLGYDSTVALVTGGSKGIGRAAVRALASEGAAVAFTYHRDDAGAEVLAEEISLSGGRATAHRYSLGNDPDDLVRAVIQAHGRLDILIANAIEWPQGVTVQQAVAVNLAGTIGLVDTALATICEARGRVVVVSSNIATDGMPGSQTYAAIKAGLLGAVACWSKEHGPQGVLVNAVLPGLTLTERVLQLPPSVRAGEAERTPTQRLATPEEVADAIVWLGSPRNTHITGQQLRVMGGL